MVPLAALAHLTVNLLYVLAMAAVVAVLAATGNVPLAAILLRFGAVVAPLVGALRGARLAAVDRLFLGTAGRLAPVS
jgi:hypothetical protein